MESPSAARRSVRARAFAVHVFTALGAGFALMALLEAVRGHWAAMFAWLGLALVVDALDGPLARRLRIAEVLPNWSGETLDLVVDFTTYVFVPAYAIAASGFLVPHLAPLVGVAVVVSGALYFADQRMKTDDNHFRGFPTLWNVAAFYLFLLRPSPWLGQFCDGVAGHRNVSADPRHAPGPRASGSAVFNIAVVIGRLRAGRLRGVSQLRRARSGDGRRFA